MSQVNRDLDTEILLKLLEHNFVEVAGVRRLDQQLVYVPLAAVAGAAYSAAANHDAIRAGLGQFVQPGLAALALFVLAGLVRNTLRHRELLMRRGDYLAALPIPLSAVGLDALFWAGRVIYFLLFVLGLWAAGTALLWVLP